jgi:hypothetical protein
VCFWGVITGSQVLMIQVLMMQLQFLWTISPTRKTKNINVGFGVKGQQNNCTTSTNNYIHKDTKHDTQTQAKVARFWKGRGKKFKFWGLHKQELP